MSRKIILFAALMAAAIALVVGLTLPAKPDPEPTQIEHPETVETQKASTAIVTLSEPSAAESEPEISALPENEKEEEESFITIDCSDCYAAAVYSVSEGRLIAGGNIDAPIAPASITKLLTAAVACKYCDLDMLCTVGSEQWLVQPNSSICNLQMGNILSLRNLLAGMLIASGNDAAYTVAVSVARAVRPELYDDCEAVEYFCELMNCTAREMDMCSSHFTNPDGWDDYDQYTTMSDLLTLGENVLKIPELREIVGTHYKSVAIYSNEEFYWSNSNKLLDPYSVYYDPQAIGIKTGTTYFAGHNLLAAFDIDGDIYLTAVAGSCSDDDRYAFTLELKDLID